MKEQGAENPFNIHDLLQQTMGSRAEFLKTYVHLKQAFEQLNKEGASMLESWLNEIYYKHIKANRIPLFEAHEITMTPQTIETTVSKFLVEVCDSHKQLIGESMRFMQEANSSEHYFRVDIDTDVLGDHVNTAGFFDESISHQWVNDIDNNNDSSLRPTMHLTVNNNYYHYCLWVIYNHYCSLTERNREVRMLVHKIQQNVTRFDSGEELGNQDPEFKKDDLHGVKLSRMRRRAAESFDNSQKLMQIPKNKHDKELGDQNVARNKRILVDENSLIKEIQINILTFKSLIPLDLPRVQSSPTNESNDQDYLYYEQVDEEMLYHSRKFQSEILKIIYSNSQNMRRYCVYLQEFKNTVRILKKRLYRKKLIIRRRSQELDKERYRNYLMEQIVMEKKREMGDLSDQENDEEEVFRQSYHKYLKDRERIRSIEASQREERIMQYGENQFEEEEAQQRRREEEKKISEEYKKKLQEMLKGQGRNQKPEDFIISEKQKLLSSFTKQSETVKKTQKAMKNQQKRIDNETFMEIVKKSIFAQLFEKSNGDKNDNVESSHAEKEEQEMIGKNNVRKQKSQPMKQGKPSKKQKQRLHHFELKQKHFQFSSTIFRYGHDESEGESIENEANDYVDFYQLMKRNKISESDDKNGFKSQNEIEEEGLEKQKSKKSKKRKKKKKNKKQELPKSQSQSQSQSKAEESVYERQMPKNTRQNSSNSKEEVSQQIGVIKLLQEMKINHEKRNNCYPISEQKIRRWEKEAEERNCSKKQFISLPKSMIRKTTNIK